jgi:hypothetical protein
MHKILSPTLPATVLKKIIYNACFTNKHSEIKKKSQFFLVPCDLYTKSDDSD